MLLFVFLEEKVAAIQITLYIKRKTIGTLRYFKFYYSD